MSPKQCLSQAKQVGGERRDSKQWEKHFILHTSWLYGVHGKNFASTMLPIYGDGQNVWDWLGTAGDI